MGILIYQFAGNKPRQKKASLVLCAVLMLNLLFGSIAMAAAITGSHHSGDISSHSQHLHQNQHNIADQHQIDLHMENTSHDCCEESITEVCANMAACAAHCAQPLPTLWQQPHSIFCLSCRLDVIALGNLASIDPSRQFKPPRT